MEEEEEGEVAKGRICETSNGQTTFDQKTLHFRHTLSTWNIGGKAAL